MKRTTNDAGFELKLREGGSGVSSLSPLPGDDWFSGPDEKSVSNGRCGVVNDGLRNWIGAFIDGVEGNRNVCEAGSRNTGTEGLDGDWSSLNGPEYCDQYVAFSF